MADPYYRYAPPERDPRPPFPGYSTSEGSALASHYLRGAGNLQGTSSVLLQNDILPSRSGGYGLDDLAGIGSRVTPGLGGLATGASIRGFTPLEDPALIRRDVALGVKPVITGIERSDPLRKTEDPRPTLPGYFPSEGSAFASHYMRGAGNLQGTSSEFLQNDILPLRSGGYSLDDHAGIGSRVPPGLGGLAAGARGFTPLEDPALIRRDVALGVKPGTTDIKQSDPLRKSDGLSADESNILFVDGLPNDCTRREVGHLFRPFIGFKEIRVVHKEPRRAGEKAQVLCFVEFNDSKCALTALETLQDYTFDDKKPDAPVLRIQFAKFPFRPSGRDDPRHGNAH